MLILCVHIAPWKSTTGLELAYMYGNTPREDRPVPSPVLSKPTPPSSVLTLPPSSYPQPLDPTEQHPQLTPTHPSAGLTLSGGGPLSHQISQGPLPIVTHPSSSMITYAGASSHQNTAPSFNPKDIEKAVAGAVASAVRAAAVNTGFVCAAFASLFQLSSLCVVLCFPPQVSSVRTVSVVCVSSVCVSAVCVSSVSYISILLSRFTRSGLSPSSRQIGTMHNCFKNGETAVSFVCGDI